MDIVDAHFAAENAHDVPGTLATYTDDIVWDDVTHPLSPVQGKEAVGAVYTDILNAIPDVSFESIRRFRSEDGLWVVDVSEVTGHVEGEWAGIAGGGAPVQIRMLHMFRLRDGLIEYENTWFDSA
ncbi:MAG: nuclear transport factor 2 family protein, partial [Acidimicrobiia bacterium]